MMVPFEEGMKGNKRLWMNSGPPEEWKSNIRDAMLTEMKDLDPYGRGFAVAKILASITLPQDAMHTVRWASSGNATSTETYSVMEEWDMDWVRRLLA